MKYGKIMTKILSVLVMASMIGTSVQMPTLAQIQTASQAIADNAVEMRDAASDGEGSAEPEDTVAADDEEPAL